MIEGLSESGLTFFYLDEGADSGDILWQRSFPVALEDDASTLYGKIKVLASAAMQEIIPQLNSGNPPRRPQDHGLATYWRKRTEADGEVIWHGSALTAHNLIRALTHPYPGAHTFAGNQRISIWRSQMAAGQSKTPVAALGEITSLTLRGFVVQCSDGALEITDWSTPNALELRVGLRLGTAA